MRDVPHDYYRRLHAVEDSHWWPVGMRELMGALLAPALDRRDLSLLDIGCGTGGFLRWAARTGAFGRLCGVDISPEAIDVAGRRLPSAELHVSSLLALPFEDGAFDVVALNDVLQHVDEGGVETGLREAARVVRSEGELAVRTNAGRCARQERQDWRLYDEQTLRADLERSGFRVIRTTHANMLFSAWASLRGRGPKAPTERSCGVPLRAGSVATAVGRASLGLEARYLRHPRRRLSYGHTLLALATPSSGY